MRTHFDSSNFIFRCRLLIRNTNALFGPTFVGLKTIQKREKGDRYEHLSEIFLAFRCLNSTQYFASSIQAEPSSISLLTLNLRKLPQKLAQFPGRRGFNLRHVHVRRVDTGAQKRTPHTTKPMPQSYLFTKQNVLEISLRQRVTLEGPSLSTVKRRISTSIANHSQLVEIFPFVNSKHWILFTFIH